MLPKKTREQQSTLQKMLDDPKKCFEDHAGEFLIGVYDIDKDKVILLPCISELVWLEMDERTGKYVRGWEATRDTNTLVGSAGRGKELSPEQVEKYNDSPLPPRVISIQGKGDIGNLTWPHTFVVELLGDMANKDRYRGFSVKPGKDGQEPTYQWNSASLNFSVTRGNVSKVMPKEYQEKITTTMNQWVKESENQLSIEKTPTVKLETIKNYYGHEASNEKGRRHIFSARSMKEELKNFSGDQLKFKILESFKTQMENCTSEDELKEKIKEIKNCDEYKVLAKGQGIATRFFGIKTGSVRAFDKMVGEISQRFDSLQPLKLKR